jgi:hypothetical protein
MTRVSAPLAASSPKLALGACDSQADGFCGSESQGSRALVHAGSGNGSDDVAGCDGEAYEAGEAHMLALMEHEEEAVLVSPWW